MSQARTSFDSSVAAALEASPPRIPVIVGPCGAGRTSLLHRLRARGEPAACQYVSLARAVSTPERFLASVRAASPFDWPQPVDTPAGPREAFDLMAMFLTRARTGSGRPATFLLDEFLEVKTFEHFPGLRHAVTELIGELAASDNRFVLTTRFVFRMLRELRAAPDRFAVLHLPPLAIDDVAEPLRRQAGLSASAADEAARVVLALTDGRAAYAGDVVRMMASRGADGRDPVAAFAALLAPGGEINHRCRHSYEFRLHRARGYGSLKAVLGILADEEPLNLTEIAARMQRTPGSTKDYLGWLQDVDLVAVERKRYRVADPVLRLWISLHTRCDAPEPAEVGKAVRRYASSI